MAIGIMKNNDFTLELPGGLSKFSFEIKSYNITNGQPWEGISNYSYGENSCTITIRAGRKGSTDVAKWFSNQVKGEFAIGCFSSDPMPSTLNFALKGNMIFTHGGHTYTGKNIVIAQGHNAASRNNWWIGGADMSGASVSVVGAAAEQNFKKSGLSPLPAVIVFVATLKSVNKMTMGILEV